MRTYKPLQRQDGRWEMAVLTRDGGHPTGYCTGWRIPDEDVRTKPVEEWTREHPGPPYHDDGHATAEEAAACFRQYEIDRAREVEYTSAHKCAVCQEWTPLAYALSCDIVYLCAEHRTRENLEDHVPEYGSEYVSWRS